MAKRTETSSKSGGSQKSRSLVYEESYFKNRNDMLQSSLDSVYQRIDAEGLAYEARLKATKDLTRALDKELQRLRKMRDDLDVRQLDKNAASQQWSAGQRNAANRTEFLVKASNSRFLADKAFDRAAYGSGTSTKAAGIPGLDETSQNEANRSYTSYPDDPNAGLKDFREKIFGVGEFDKNNQQVDLATAYGVDTYVTNKLIQLDRGEGDPGTVAAYQELDARGQRDIAVQAVLDSITDPAVVKSATRGYEIAEALAKKKGAGVSDEELGKMVYSGSIPVNTSTAPDYSALKGELDKRISELQSKREQVTPEAPVPLSERNIIEEQRDEYFRTFYPSATPAYQTNRLMQSILSGNLDPQSEAIIMDILSAERKAARMPAEGPLGPEIENAGAIRGFSGKQGARMPGDIIYGEGSPFVPEESPLSDQALKILSNKGTNQFFGEGLSDAKIQGRANDLFKLGLGLTKVTKEDGKVLYTVVPFDRLGTFKPEDRVMPVAPEDRRDKDKRTLPLPQQVVSDTEEIQLINKQIDDGLKELNAAKKEAEAEADKMGITLEDLLRNPLVKQRLDPKIAAYSELVKRRSALLGRRSDTLLMTPPASINIEEPEGRLLVKTLLEDYEAAQAQIREAGKSGDQDKIRAAAQQAIDIKVELDKALKELDKISGAPEQQTVQKPEMVLDYARSYLGDFPNMDMVRRETEGYPDLAEPRRLLPPGDRAEVRRILNDKPTEPEPTADGKDASLKINALESAAKLVDNDELGRMLKTPVGSAIEQLYKANKAKGNQTDKELLGYIAKEFPKVDDQKTAATALFGLSYQDQLSGKLG